jgi:hypothetical protein
MLIGAVALVIAARYVSSSVAVSANMMVGAMLVAVSGLLIGQKRRTRE